MMTLVIIIINFMTTNIGLQLKWNLSKFNLETVSSLIHPNNNETNRLVLSKFCYLCGDKTKEMIRFHIKIKHLR